MGRITRIICKFLTHNWAYYSKTRTTTVMLTSKIRDSVFEEGDCRVCRTCLQVDEFKDGVWTQVSGP